MAVTANGQMTEDKQSPGASRSEADRRRQRRKNLALAAALAIFAILVYFVAIVRMSGGG